MTDAPNKIEEIRAALEGATPGPWKIGIDTDVYAEGECDTWITLGPQNYDAVALVVNEHIKNDAEVGINARLIALAPDMARIVLEQAEEIERLRKALGQIACTSAGEDGCYYTNRINIQRARAALTYRATQETDR